ncbi:MAG: 16S rRNA (cytidine(1402)-2'-O)-methyltransferase [Deltaproteobacteria bacterium]|nr:16S rRNA (cytidine(1402)-2'-O)-methyltransferase [Deltaproteobacteria bacterium]
MKPAEGSGLLSVVATPIGNLDDITLRAIEVLRRADVILAEDTRRTKRLTTHLGVATRLKSFHAHSPPGAVQGWVAELLGGAHLAIVTDAGTPVVSDPGIRLVAACREAGVPVEAIPGPSAVTAAIAVAGLRADAFRFVGFLPRSGGRRRRVLEEIGTERGATVLFEAPGRVGKTLSDLVAVVGADRQGAICRELTKLHEEVTRGPLSELIERAAEGIRGEVTLVVEGTGLAAGSVPEVTPEDARDRAEELLADGLTPRDAARRLAEETAMPKKQAYSLILSLAGGST